ncbi:CocE/NonD family hydrolase [Nocardia sp. NBC_01388]|uniref:CocE/NonD family hydrolase n=1 Tax=Nocardia sp. NBC_01388 TaxID=2903596 RepID=UPI003248FD9D
MSLPTRALDAYRDSVVAPLEGRLFERLLGLPPATTRNVRITRNIRVPMPDGVELVADLYEPIGVPVVGTVMSRTPYARVGMTSRATAMPFAERGFNVLLQSCRGTHGGSGGAWDPVVNEESDGLATLDWIERQPWFNGKLFTYGPSYVGITQLALLPGAGNRITAALPQVTNTAINEALFPGGVFFTALGVQWIRRLKLLETSALLADFVEIIGDRTAQRAMNTVPLTAADKAATGRTVPYFQDWMSAGTGRDDPYWKGAREFRSRVRDIVAPVNFYAAWQDFMLLGQIDDYQLMRAAGREPYLTIGNHPHVHTETMAGGFREGFAWFTAMASGDPASYRDQPVKLFMQGSDEWRYYESFPPAASSDQTWYLRPDGGLTADEPGRGTPRRFRWDPRDPTPSFGGAMLDPKLSGRKPQAERENRADVIVYSSELLDRPVEVIGAVIAHIVVRTSAPFGDLFVRLCDVDSAGVSTNVCDGIQRMDDLPPPGENDIRTVTVRLLPTAYRFASGHRLRIQVCGGSFPHFTPNAGSGEPQGTATRRVPVDYELLPGSAGTLSVMPSEGQS